MLRVRRVHLLAAAIAVATAISASACGTGGSHPTVLKAVNATSAITSTIPSSAVPTVKDSATTPSPAAPTTPPASTSAPDQEVSTPTTSIIPRNAPPLCVRSGPGYTVYDLAYSESQHDVAFFLRGNAPHQEIQTPSFLHWIRVGRGLRPYNNSITIETANGWVPDNDQFVKGEADYNASTYIADVTAWLTAWRYQVGRSPSCTQ